MHDLRVRFGFILGLALLPLLIFAVWQSILSHQIDRDNQKELLRATAQISASHFFEDIEDAKSVISLVETNKESDCDKTATDYGELFVGNATLTILKSDGTIVCGDEEVAKRIVDLRASISGVVSGPGQFQIISMPNNSVLVSPDLSRLSVLSEFPVLRLNLTRIENRVRRNLGDDFAADFAIFNSAGVLLKGTSDETMLRLVRTGNEAGQLLSTAHSAPDFARVGNREFILTRMGSGEAMMITESRRSLALEDGIVIVLSSAILPVLAWVFGFIAICIATDRMILTHLRQLRTALVRFSSGNHDVRLGDLDNPPSSIRQLGRSFDLLAERVTRREEDLRQSLVEKENLLREVHHRVKNNLQIITSLLNLQERNAQNPEDLQAVRETRTRVNAISLVHRGMYEGQDFKNIDISLFLKRLMDDLSAWLAFQNDDVTVHVPEWPIMLDFEKAVPAGLFLVEALTTLSSDYERVPGEINVDVKLEAGEFTLTVNGPSVNEKVTAKDKHLSGKLLRGFARQIGGRFDRNIVGREQNITLSFSVV